MAEVQKVSGTLLVTLEVSFTADIDMGEYREWSSDEPLDAWEVRAFLESDIDFPKNLLMAPLSSSMSVVSREIDRVEL